MSDGPSQVYSALDALGIVYERYDHPPVFTGEDAALHWADIPARGMKNLFLRNKKGTATISSSCRSRRRRICGGS